MRVMLINYRYFVSGGPERYMFNVKRLLEDAGHQVVPFSIRYAQNEPDEYDKYFVPPIGADDQVRFREHGVRLATLGRSVERLFYSQEVYKAACRLIDATKPDVAYVLHYLRKLSPSVLRACADKGVRVVVRLSDFQMVCPAATMMRDGRDCDECLGRLPLPSVRHGCVQRSRALSAADALASGFHRARGYFGLIDALVCPTRLMQLAMTRSGLCTCPAHHIPTFVPPGACEPLPFEARDLDVVFAGRLDPDKGVETLVQAHSLAARAHRGFGLSVAGADSSADALKSQALSSVRFEGFLAESDVRRLMARAKLCVVPSVWPENLPNTLLEAWACGTPVIASGIGSLAEIVAEAQAGWCFRTGDAGHLERVIRESLQSREQWRAASKSALAASRTVYGPRAHLSRLVAVLEGSSDSHCLLEGRRDA